MTWYYISQHHFQIQYRQKFSCCGETAKWHETALDWQPEDLQKAKILGKMVKAKNTAKYIQKLLQTCNSWAETGPVASTEELR